jgi:hypothetical protein
MNTEDLEEIEQETHEFFQSYLEKNIIELSHPDFFEKMVDSAAQTAFEDCVCSGYISVSEEDAFDQFREQIRIFATSYMKLIGMRRRSYKNPKSHHYVNLPIETIDERMHVVNSAYQPAQRTPEWYTFRHGLITASNIWKALGSDANVNSLICEKCKPCQARDRGNSVEGDEEMHLQTQSKYVHMEHTKQMSQIQPSVQTSVNTQSTLHWGVKYEPLSAMIYEMRNEIRIGEFGCIQHREHPFIGASPDGIVLSRSSPLYGRMLEIKNVVNREVNGIPSMPYWIQMQVQMEVCDLEECDFVETVFKEYDSTDEDGFYQNSYKYQYNGVILYFIKRDFVDNSPKYVYMPLDIPIKRSAINEWIEQQKQANREDYVLFKRIYWYCEMFSCVLVHRNREWFAAALPKIREIWSIIELERVTGCEHRKPKKKEVADVLIFQKSKCLIDLQNL